ncbi:hypothetical protein ACDI57_27845, partial [Klebsiella pneumoniae]|uniref:hypothetical protein n=1 Tax=Klebsiella pneumoniae TaxID=573 RepID=UPI003530B1AF
MPTISPFGIDGNIDEKHIISKNTKTIPCHYFSHLHEFSSLTKSEILWIIGLASFVHMLKNSQHIRFVSPSSLHESFR